MNRVLILVLVLGLLAAGIWFFLLRKKPMPTTQNNGLPRAPLAGGVSIPASAPLASSPSAPRVSTQSKVIGGLALAATVGCAGAAATYTGGAAAPICGLAGPLVTSIGNTTVKGAQAVGGAVASVFKSIF